MLGSPPVSMCFFEVSKHLDSIAAGAGQAIHKVATCGGKQGKRNRSEYGSSHGALYLEYDDAAAVSPLLMQNVGVSRLRNLQVGCVCTILMCNAAWQGNETGLLLKCSGVTGQCLHLLPV
jgi:hypothetical protein